MLDKLKNTSLYIFAFVGALGSIVVFIEYVVKPRPELEASVTFEKAKIPLIIKKQFIESYKKEIAIRDSIENLIIETIPSENQTFAISIDQNRVKRWLKGYSNSNDTINPLLNYSDLATLAISNNGEKKISSLVLTIDGSGYYEYEKYDGGSVNGIFTKKIRLGELEAAENITVLIWASYLGNSDVILKHEDDVYTVPKNVLATGRLAWVINNMPSPFAIATGIFLGIALYNLIRAWIRILLNRRQE